MSHSLMRSCLCLLLFTKINTNNNMYIIIFGRLAFCTWDFGYPTIEIKIPILKLFTMIIFRFHLK